MSKWDVDIGGTPVPVPRPAPIQPVVPAPSVQPQYIEPVQRSGVPDWMKQLVTTVAIVGLIGGGYFAYQNYVADKPEVVIENGEDPFVETGSDAESAARSYVNEYSKGLSKLYSKAADRIKDGNDESLKDVRDFIKLNKEDIETNAFKPMAKVLESINDSEEWDSDKSAEIFEDFAKGFK